ncbi:hypothetical protein GAY31_14480 [Azospirillum brasilense]|nr:hypothetical protein [Azospirillum brasilense]
MQGCGVSAFQSVPIPASMKPFCTGRVRLCEDRSGVEYLFRLIPDPRRGRSSPATLCFATERTDPIGTSRGAVRSDQWKDHKDKTLRFRMVITETSPKETKI